MGGGVMGWECKVGERVGEEGVVVVVWGGEVMVVGGWLWWWRWMQCGRLGAGG